MATLQSVQPRTGAAWACRAAARVWSSPQHLGPGEETELHAAGAGPGDQTGVLAPGPRGELKVQPEQDYKQKSDVKDNARRDEEEENEGGDDMDEMTMPNPGKWLQGWVIFDCPQAR